MPAALEIMGINILVIAQVLTLSISIYIAFTKSVRRLFVADFILNASLLACYILISDTATALIYIIGAIRSFLYIYKDRFRGNIVPVLMIVLSAGVGLATMRYPHQLLSIATACWVCWYMWSWHDNKQKIRLGNVLANASWGIYNSIVGLCIVVIMRVFLVCANMVSIYQHRGEGEQSSDEATDDVSDD